MSSTLSSDAALDFLISRICSQASLDKISVTEAEKKLLHFSAVLDEDTPDDPSCSDDAAFEAKFADIAKRAFKHDRSDQQLALQWKEAITKLRQGDYYILIVLGEAGIRAARPTLRSLFEPDFWGLVRSLIIPALLVGMFILLLIRYVRNSGGWIPYRYQLRLVLPGVLIFGLIWAYFKWVEPKLR